ncbi:hypothetical protein [Streptomyces sp. URMC 129]|uniref:hypothetical protein n=1 Tax=Streptomyces sp. URMC 129 TaxID=3423407 RepID=UPI003F1A6977
MSAPDHEQHTPTPPGGGESPATLAAFEQLHAKAREIQTRRDHKLIADTLRRAAGIWADAAENEPTMCRSVAADLFALADDPADFLRRTEPDEGRAPATGLAAYLRHANTSAAEQRPAGRRCRICAPPNNLLTEEAACCHLHKPDGCCDPEDCGPCCMTCPTCPTLAPPICENCGHPPHGHAQHLTNPAALMDCPACPCASELRELVAVHARELANLLRAEHRAVYDDAGQRTAEGVTRAAGLLAAYADQLHPEPEPRKDR